MAARSCTRSNASGCGVRIIRGVQSIGEMCVTKGRRVAAWLLLAAALGLAVVGQWYFFRRREYLWDGVVFHLLAAICFLLAWRLSQTPAPRTRFSRPSRLGSWLQARPVPPVLLALGVLLSLMASLLARERPPGQSSFDAVFFWGLGVLAVGLAALWPEAWPPRSLHDWRRRLRGIGRATWLELATVTALTLFALVLRVAALDSVPYTLGGDEAWHGLLARQVLSGELRSPFSMGYMSMPTGFYWPLSWSLWLVGNNVTGLRLPAALVGSATVPILYLFARDLWGRRTALLSALFLAGYDYHVHYSRLGANNAWDPLFVLLTLWALDRDRRAWVGADALGERGKPAEAVGREAAGKLREVLATGAAADAHLADNLIPLLALCGGEIRTTAVTDHIRANMYVCEAFLGVRFHVDETAGVIGVAR